MLTDLLCSDSNPPRYCHPCKLVDEQKSLNVIWLVGEAGEIDVSGPSTDAERWISLHPLRWFKLILLQMRFKNWIYVTKEKVWASFKASKTNKGGISKDS